MTQQLYLNVDWSKSITFGVSQNDSVARIPLPDQSIDLIITDPPYNLTSEAKARVHSEMVRVCRGDIIVFSPPENAWEFPGLTSRLFWVKSPSTKNYTKNYGRFVEMIFYYRRGASVWNKNLKWSNYTGVYEDIVVGDTGHEHEKPLSLIERFVRIHSTPKQVILDPFCGSGTTLVAAKNLGRHYVGFDINGELVEKVKERLI